MLTWRSPARLAAVERIRSRLARASARRKVLRSAGPCSLWDSADDAIPRKTASGRELGAAFAAHTPRARPTGEDLQVPVSKDQVKDAPPVDAGQELSEAEERQLFEHYGIPYTTDGSTTATGSPTTGAAGSGDRGYGQDVSGPNTDDAMTRSEEELRVGKTQQERGRARLRKYVVTENVQQTVPVQREEVRLAREPITDENVDRALDGPEISEEEHEVVLHEEQPV